MSMSWITRRPVALGLGLLVLVLPAGAQAAILVSIGSTTVTPGSPATIDVLISSDSGGIDRLDTFTARFSITKIVNGVPPTGVMVFDTAAYPGGTPSDPISPYIFGADSSTQMVTFLNPLNPVLLDVSDSASSFPGPVVPDAANATGLIRLKLISDPSFSTQPGDVYQIDVVAEDDMMMVVTTFIDFSQSDPLPYTYTPGTITVTAIPEPGTLGLAAVGAVVGMGLWRRRRRR